MLLWPSSCPQRNQPPSAPAGPVDVAPAAPVPSAAAALSAAAQPPTWQREVANVLLWKDVSRSALVFGAGTLALVSGGLAPPGTIAILPIASYAVLCNLAYNFVRAVLGTPAPAPPTSQTAADFHWLATAAANVANAVNRQRVVSSS